MLGVIVPPGFDPALMDPGSGVPHEPGEYVIDGARMRLMPTRLRCPICTTSWLVAVRDVTAARLGILLATRDDGAECWAATKIPPEAVLLYCEGCMTDYVALEEGGTALALAQLETER